MGLGRELRLFFLGEKVTNSAERKLLRKADTFILSYLCLSQFTNFLDRSNLANAYVSGMKEEIGFKGNEYNKTVTIFTIGYILGGIPQSFIVSSHKIRLSYWLPFCCFCWGMLTLGVGFCHHVWQIQIVRFFMGMFESVSFAGGHYILGSWYKPSELGKRACLLTASQNLGSLFAGIMQGAIYTTMDGKLGLSGWRWLMVINCLMTAPIWVFGFLTFPGEVANCNRWYLTDKDKKLAVSRLPVHESTPLNWGVFRKVFRDWRWWAFVGQFCFNTQMEWAGLYTPMALWMKWTKNYTVPQINYYPLGTTTITVVSTCLFALWTDYVRSRWWVNIVMGVTSAISCIMLLVPSLPVGGKFFAWYLAGMGYIGQAVNFSWANEICRDDDQLRSLTLYGMAQGSNVMIAWWNIAFFSVTDLPNFTKGYSASLAVCLLSPPLAFFIHKRCQKLGLYRRAPVETEARSVTEPSDDEENSVATKAETRGEKDTKMSSGEVI